MARGKRFADDGWAVWIDGDDTSTVYLNNWIDPKGESYMDIAIRIRGVIASKTLNIYVPFPLQKEEVEDISLKFHDERILRATFSVGCIIDYKKNRYTSEVAYNAKTVDLVHIGQANYTVTALAAGSLISADLVSLRPYLDNDEAYILFRVPHKSLDDIFKLRINVGGTLARLRDLITSPVISETYGYSIRINEARLLPSEINRIGAFHRQKLKKAVVTISIAEDYELNDSNCYRIRRLEENLYKNYVPEGFACNDVITYQWNQRREEDLRGHFSFYFSIARNSISQVSMMIYVLLLPIIGASGSALWDLIKLLFQ